MRILYVADGRSPITLSWMEYFLAGGHEVHLVSTFPCDPDPRLASYKNLPLAFSGLKKQEPVAAPASAKPKNFLWGAGMVGLRTSLRQWLGPSTLPAAARQLSAWIKHIQPDLVHALRIPYEGMVAAMANPAAPLLVSVWGNDFTLHAKANPWMANLTRRTLQRAQALQSDCQRDIRLAQSLGFGKDKPTLVVPGAGGIHTDVFFPPSSFSRAPTDQNQSINIINPRGVRAYIRNDVFFQSIPLVLKQKPAARFFCPNMADEPLAQKWLKDLGIENQTTLLPRLSRAQMADLFRSASMVISPSVHDGTPNSLLEAMACGCFPIAGDLESIREWITSGENGFLFDPADPQALAQAILAAFDSPALLVHAREMNLKMISERARYDVVAPKVEKFYQALLAR